VVGPLRPAPVRAAPVRKRSRSEPDRFLKLPMRVTDRFLTGAALIAGADSLPIRCGESAQSPAVRQRGSELRVVPRIADTCSTNLCHRRCYNNFGKSHEKFPE